MSDLAPEIDRSAAWVGMASAALGVLDVVATLACVRWWVSTSDFGAATLAIALLPIVDRLGGMGLGAAIVRDGDGSPRALSTVYWLALAVAGAVAGVLIAARPLLAPLFPAPIVASLIAAYGVRLVVQTASVVPEALMKRALRYRELSLIRICASACDTAVKLGCAYAGARAHSELRVWCFALGPIANTLVTAALVQLRCPWRPRRVFDRAIAVRAARFTSALSGSELVYYAYTSADYLAIGTAFGDAAVGVYRLAYELVLDVVRLVSMVTAEVAFPAFARLAGDPRAAGAQLVRFSRQNLVVLAPFLAFIAIEADDVLALLYPALPPAAATAARVLCIAGAVRAMGFVVPPLLAGLGRAPRVLAYNVCAAVVLTALFVGAAAVGGSFVAVAWAWAIGYPIAFVVLLALALPLVGVSGSRYARALVGIAGCATVALCAGAAVRAVAEGSEVLRALAVGAVIIVVYGVMLARVERITPRAVVRALARD